MTQQFGVFAPIQVSNNVVFGGRENNQIGDVLIGIYCGMKQSQKGAELYMFLDEVNGYRETIIFGCTSIKEALNGKSWCNTTKRMTQQAPAVQPGNRIAIQMSGRRDSTAKDKCGVGKVMCYYSLQLDSSFQLDPGLIPLIQKAMTPPQAAPAANPYAQQRQQYGVPQAPAFGQFQQAPVQPSFVPPQQPTFAQPQYQPQYHAPAQPTFSQPQQPTFAQPQYQQAPQQPSFVAPAVQQPTFAPQVAPQAPVAESDDSDPYPQ